MTDWQDISTAPKDGAWVLLYHKYARISDWYWDGEKWNNDHLDWSEGELGPTHWTPVPDPPKDAGK